MPVFYSPVSDIILAVLCIALLMAGGICMSLAREKSVPYPLPAWRYLGVALLVLAIREWIGIIGVSEPGFVSWYPVAAAMQITASIFVLMAARPESGQPGKRTDFVHAAIVVLLLVMLAVITEPYFSYSDYLAAGKSLISATLFFSVKTSLFAVSLILVYCTWRSETPPPDGVKIVVILFAALALIIVFCRPPGVPSQPEAVVSRENNAMLGLFALRIVLSFAMAVLIWNIYAKTLGVAGRIRWWPLLFMFFLLVIGLAFVLASSARHEAVIDRNMRIAVNNAAEIIPPEALLEAAAARGSVNNPFIAGRLFGKARNMTFLAGYTDLDVQVDVLAAPTRDRPAVALIDVQRHPDGGTWAKGGEPLDTLWSEVRTFGTLELRRDDLLEPTVLLAPVRDRFNRPVGAAVLSVSSIDLVRSEYVFRRTILLFLPVAFFVLMLMVAGQQRSWLASHSSSRAEALRRGALDNDLAGVMILRNDVIVDLNQRCSDILGYAREELVGHDVKDRIRAILPEGSQPVADTWPGVGSEGPSTFELSVRRPDGKRVELLVFGRQASAGDEEPHYIWESVDITRQKKMENALTEARNFLQTILDSLPVAVFVKDNEGRYQLANQSFAEIMGYKSVPDVIGKTIGEIRPLEEAATRLHDEICHDMRGGTLVYDQPFMINGQEKYFELSKTLKLVGDNHETPVIVGSVHDLTGRKKYQDELKAERHFLFQLINTLPVSVCFLDTDLVIRLCDRDFCREAGCEDPDDFAGRPYADVAPYGQPDADDDRALLDRGSGFSDTEFELKKDGRTRNFIVRRSVMRSPDGEVLGLVKAFWDTTALVAATLAAKKADRAKAAFLSNMSHELRTPMNGIVGMSDLIIDHESTEPVQRLYAETIIKSAKTLQMVMDEVMEVATIDDEDRRFAVNRAPFPLLPLTEEAAQIVSCIVGAWGVELSLSFDFSLHGVYVGDARHIRQVMVQILTHCSRVTADKRMRLEVAAADGGRIRIGAVFRPEPGTSRDLLEEMFRNPEYADGASRGPANLGMFNDRIGLPLAWRLVRSMNGSLAVAEDGEAMRCDVLLPLPRDDASATRPPSGLDGLNALVATADDGRAAAVHACLEYAGAAAVRAESRQATTRLLRSALDSGRAFDVLFLDSRLVEGDELPGFVGELSTTADYGGPAIMLVASSQQVQNLGGLDGRVKSLFLPPVCPSEVWYKTAAAFNTGQPADALAGSRPRSTRITRLVKIPAAVLLVEDNTVNQMVAMGILKRIGCNPVLARNGEEAVSIISRGDAFDIIFMDCMMPVMDGYEATGRIRMLERSHPGSRRNTIVALTANSVAGDKEKCLAAGMDDYLSKPVTLERLRDIMLKHCPGLATMVDQIEGLVN